MSTTFLHYWRATFWPTLENAMAPVTRHTYGRFVRKFADFAGDDILLENVTEERIEAFGRWLEQRGSGVYDVANNTRLIRRIVAHSMPPAAVNDPLLAAGQSNAPEGSLLHLLETKYIVENPLRPRTLLMYRDALRAYRRYLEREPMIDDLTRTDVNDYLLASERSGLSSRAIKGRWNILRLLWRYAWNEGLVADLPRGIRKIRLKALIPDAWTPSEMATLIGATYAERFDRDIGLPPKCGHLGNLLRAVILLAYDSGLRASDLRTVTRANLRTGGRLLLICEKTQHPKLCQLRSETIAALEEVAVGHDERLFPWPIRRMTFYHWWKVLLIEAGFPQSPRNGIQKIRRTAATLLERQRPGSATAFLGHRTGDLARKHYLDPLLSAEVAMPPDLPEPPKRIGGPKHEVA